jgi:hypothetical protein
MQTIATKLTAVRPFAAGFTDNELRSLIHGTGGSPRRAKRLLKTSLVAAKELATKFADDIREGTPFVTAVQAANARYAEIIGAGTEDDDAVAKPSPKAKGKAKATAPMTVTPDDAALIAKLPTKIKGKATAIAQALVAAATAH